MFVDETLMVALVLVGGCMYVVLLRYVLFYGRSLCRLSPERILTYDLHRRRSNLCSLSFQACMPAAVGLLLTTCSGTQLFPSSCLHEAHNYDMLQGMRGAPHHVLTTSSAQCKQRLTLLRSCWPPPRGLGFLHSFAHGWSRVPNLYQGLNSQLR